MAKSERIFHILVIDDNPADAVLIQHAWSECEDVRTDVKILQDSREAMKYVKGDAPFLGAPKPDLVMLDYRHPMNGGLALTEIKSSPDFVHLPVVVLSGSSNPRDYLDAYRRHANICFRKPMEASEFLDLVCHVAETWLLKAVLPAA